MKQRNKITLFECAAYFLISSKLKYVEVQQANGSTAIASNPGQPLSQNYNQQPPSGVEVVGQPMHQWTQQLKWYLMSADFMRLFLTFSKLKVIFV